MNSSAKSSADGGKFASQIVCLLYSIATLIIQYFPFFLSKTTDSDTALHMAQTPLLASDLKACSQNQCLWNWEPCDLPCFMLDHLYNLRWSHLQSNHPLVCPFKCQCLLTVKQHFHKDISFLWCKTFSNNQVFQSLFGES